MAPKEAPCGAPCAGQHESIGGVETPLAYQETVVPALQNLVAYYSPPGGNP